MLVMSAPWLMDIESRKGWVLVGLEELEAFPDSDSFFCCRSENTHLYNRYTTKRKRAPPTMAIQTMAARGKESVAEEETEEPWMGDAGTVWGTAATVGPAEVKVVVVRVPREADAAAGAAIPARHTVECCQAVQGGCREGCEYC